MAICCCIAACCSCACRGGCAGRGCACACGAGAGSGGWCSSADRPEGLRCTALPAAAAASPAAPAAPAEVLGGAAGARGLPPPGCSHRGRLWCGIISSTASAAAACSSACRSARDMCGAVCSWRGAAWCAPPAACTSAPAAADPAAADPAAAAAAADPAAAAAAADPAAAAAVSAPAAAAVAVDSSCGSSSWEELREGWREGCLLCHVCCSAGTSKPSAACTLCASCTTHVARRRWELDGRLAHGMCHAAKHTRRTAVAQTLVMQFSACRARRPTSLSAFTSWACRRPGPSGRSSSTSPTDAE